ncbi:MAG: hypothetical protein ACKOHK_01425, partial [Planctomycetia bacterium]
GFGVGGRGDHRRPGRLCGLEIGQRLAGGEALGLRHGRGGLLERAGLKMAVDPAASPADRQSQFAKFQSDAPACDNCGSITVRNGNCYLCHNCGNSMGCS